MAEGSGLGMRRENLAGALSNKLIKKKSVKKNSHVNMVYLVTGQCPLCVFALSGSGLVVST